MSGICLLFWTGSVGLAQDKPRSFDVTHEVVIAPLNRGLYHMVVDLGDLHIGSKGKIHLDLVNNFDFDFPVKDLSVSCGCSSAAFDKEMIAAHATGRLELTLETALTRRKADQSFQIRLISGQGVRHDITLAIRYRLAGLIAFGEAMVSQQVNPNVKRQQLAVPFVVTPPAEANKISFDLSPPNDGVVARLAPNDAGWQVIIEIDPIFTKKEGFFTTLNAKGAAGNVVDQMTLSLFHIEDVELSPRTLIFREDKDGEKVRADGILCLHEPKDRPLDDQIPSINAMIGEVKLAVDCSRIGKGIYRVRVTGQAVKLASHREDIDGDSKITWHIVTNSRAVELSSLVHFSLISKTLQK